MSAAAAPADADEYDRAMPSTLGIITIGQAPRDDIADLFATHAPAGTKVVLRGALDGLSDAEVDTLKPENGADTLYTRLRGGRDVKISKKAVIARSPAAFAKLRADGCDVLVYACTGDFPPLPGDEGVVFPSRVLNGLATGLLPRGRFGLLIPLAEQGEKLASKWARPGLEVVAEALAPSAGADEAGRPRGRLAAHKPDLVAMDCMSYTPATKEWVKGPLGVPALLAITATGRVLARDARMTAITTQCCIVGGGPAGMMLGFLLARTGVRAVVLEKHGDFLRDFRGDTVHPSTLNVMDELGLLDEFLKLPHQEVARFGAQFGEEHVQVADFSHLPVRCGFIAMMPQWDFLDFLAAQGKRYPTFTVLMHAEASGLIEEAGRVVGVRATVDGRAAGDPRRPGGRRRRPSFDGARRRRASSRSCGRADGRAVVSSHPQADRHGRDHGPLRSRQHPGDARSRRLLAVRLRHRQGIGRRLKAAGIEKFRSGPCEADAVPRPTACTSWPTVDDLKLLTVGVDRLEKWWKPGLLCIGDAAHTMSPIGGVGVNIAVQDAVAAANILAGRSRRGD